jgi:hypothetical protein
MGSGSDNVTPTFADSIYNKKIAKEGVGLPSFFAKPCIAGGALEAISHITAKLEASFSVNGEQHTHLFGLFFDWLRLASASSSFGRLELWTRP